MFSKELEDLIQATLEDGVLEENEKAALVKRAQREGVDLDELEIYINSLIQKRQRELNEKRDLREEEYEKKKKEAIGPVCPKCGKQVPALTLKCDCGYEFQRGEHESSVKKLFEKINLIQSRRLNGQPGSYEWDEDRKSRDQEMLDVISLFPVPNTKEDIMEFLSLSIPKAKKKGGILGTIYGRIILGLIILAIVMIVVNLFLPDSYTETRVIDGGLLFKDEEITETHNPKDFLYILGFGGFVVVCCLSIFVGNETLRWNKFATTWRAKFDQVLMKGRSLRADAEFTKMLDYYESQMKMNEIESKKIFGIKLFG